MKNRQLISRKLWCNTGISPCDNSEGQDAGLGARLHREGIYVYLRLIHKVVQRKPTQHCKAVILQLKINSKNNLMVTKGRMGEGGINQEYGICRYNLLYKKQILYTNVYMWNLEKWYLFERQEQRHRVREQTCGHGGGGRGEGGVKQIGRLELIHQVGAKAIVVLHS